MFHAQKPTLTGTLTMALTVTIALTVTAVTFVSCLLNDFVVCEKKTQCDEHVLYLTR